MKQKKGQTVIEFAFISVLFIFMLVLTMNVILAFCYQQYFSYAAFMAARAYQASTDSTSRQREHALAMMQRMIPGLSDVVSSVDQANTQVTAPIQFKTFFKKNSAVITTVVIPTDKGNGETGAFGPIAPFESTSGSSSGNKEAFIMIRFRVPIVQFAATAALAQFQTVDLEAKSFLGRETSGQEVRNFFASFFASATQATHGQGHDADLSLMMSDNGW